jgi:hypothetical protein
MYLDILLYDISKCMQRKNRCTKKVKATYNLKRREYIINPIILVYGIVNVSMFSYISLVEFKIA